ncbi:MULTISPECIES: hypothetical protein [unclassified Chryseobacterium]|uniref:hypothetical protein n=1 Tax=unclassified Chryseobacterium TaxID=2593645 RepID=UPI00100B1D85|nr:MULTISPECIES: hypothetical protein [unclassified Chryseobacterium]RXM50570.1 hypothetical protein BOQ64_17665 [Chryseobacterium sp. CH25]RXM63205.1 hypothetical protein BOQ60_17865 [Chryseobacterium sp. CH1]
MIRDAVLYKDNQYGKSILYFVLITSFVFIGVFGVSVFKTKDTSIVTLYNTWYFIGLLINLLVIYCIILYDKIILLKLIKKSVNNYKQHILSLLYSDIDWESLSLRGYWQELAAEKYAFVGDENIDFNYNVIHEELQYKEKPIFYFNSNKISIWLSIIFPLSGVVLSFIDIKELFGKEWQVIGYLLLIILLTVSPMIYLGYSILKGNYTEKKNEHQSMQDYVIIMIYIQEKRKLIPGKKHEKNLIMKMFRQISRR